MTIIGKMRERHLRSQIEKVAAFYAKNRSEEEITRWQLDRINGLWESYSRTIPYYGRLVSAGRAPLSFDSLEEFARTVPVPSRATVQENWQGMSVPGEKYDYLSVTGGSTGEPVRIPSRSADLSFTEPNRWWSRGWYGIRPSDRLLLFWGHTHLYGVGLRGHIKANLRRLKDCLLGYTRIPAFCMTVERAMEAVKTIEQVRPDYIIGYTAIIETIMRANLDRGRKPAHHPKAVIATTEPLSSPNVGKELEEFFGCPFAMEYGSSECDLLGHTHPDGGYRTFWGTYLIERGEETGAHAHRLYVTSLYPRLFPLVRYDLRDLVLGADPKGLSIRKFEQIISTRRELLELPGGVRIHTGALEVALRSIADIVAMQMIQGEKVSVDLVTLKEIDRTAVEQVRKRLSLVHPLFSEIAIRRVPHLRQTIAGKTPLIWRENA